MALKRLTCPSCNGPLRFGADQQRTLCLYCGSTVQLEADATTPQATAALSAAALDELKQLLLDGRRAEAVRVYQDRAGLTEAEATLTVNDLLRELTSRALLEQPISNFGVVLVGALTLAGAAVLGWGVAQGNVFAIGAGVVVLAFELLTFTRAIRTRLLQMGGQPAPAEVRRVVRLGELKMRGGPFPVARLWLDVRPPNGVAFQVEKNMVMRQHSYDQLQPGLRIEVTYTAAGQVFPTAPLKILEKQLKP